MDDIIVYSADVREHVQHLRLVFERLREHELRVSGEKCHLARTTLDFLGFEVDGDLVKPQQKHLDQVRGFPTPRTRKQLQAFLGTCGWLREHVPRYRDITAPLTEMLKGSAGKLKWGPKEEQAFCATKEAIAQSKPLARPDFDKPFCLQTDASQTGMAAVLFQMDQENKRHIISYASAKFKPAERRWHVNEQECLALVWSISHFRAYLEEKPFSVKTDSRCLTWLHRFKDSRAKLTRWALLLQEFAFTIEHVRGRDNQLPDLLSRMPEDLKYEAEPDDKRLLPPDPVMKTVSNTEHPVPDDDSIKNNCDAASFCLVTMDELYDEVARNQARSPYVRDTIAVIQALVNEADLGPTQERLVREFTVFDNLLWRRHPEGDRLYVPRAMILKVIHRFHDANDIGHPGTAETTRQISKKFFWSGMVRSVGQYISNCIVCCIGKTQQKQRTAPQRPHSPSFPWVMISLDVLGPYPNDFRTRHRFILIVEDVFSKWIEAFPLGRVEARDVVKILQTQIFARYGLPKSLVSDNGPVFCSKLLRDLCEENKISHVFSAIYHQRANPVERRCQELKKVLRILLLDEPLSKWEEKLTTALQILRGRRNRATGLSPASIVLGYELPLPGEWQTKCTKNRTLQSKNERRRRNTRIFRRQRQFQEREFPNRERQAPVQYKAGQQGNVRSHAVGVFAPAWKGPGLITRKISDLIFEVEVDGKIFSYHIDDMRLAPVGNQDVTDLDEAGPLSDEETSGDSEVEDDFRRAISSDKEDHVSVENHNMIDLKDTEQALQVVTMRVDKLTENLLRDARSNWKVQEQFEEEVTNEIINLDQIEAKGCPDIRLKRKELIAQLEDALISRKKRLHN